MKNKRVDHVRMHANGSNAIDGAECLHCGQTLELKLSMDVDEFLRLTRRFIKHHRYCPPPIPKPEPVVGPSGELGYEEIIAAISAAPQTWLPELIIHAIKTAYAQRVFVRGGASSMVENIENRLGVRGEPPEDDQERIIRTMQAAVRGCKKCEYVEAEGGLFCHCSECQHRITAKAWELFGGSVPKEAERHG